MSDRGWLMLFLFTLACFSAAAVGVASTSMSVNTWYTQLRKPALNPRNWVFGPVWFVLYLFMAVSAWLVWRNAGWNDARYAFVLFFVQLGLNVAWSGLFFGLRSPGAEMVEIFFLLAAIFATTIAFLHFSRTAFWLMMPYAACVLFATSLNFRLWQLNFGSV